MASAWSPQQREIYRIDLRAIMNNADIAANHRICVILDEPDEKGRMLVIFTAWDHDKDKCYCVKPGTDDAAPFGLALYKPSHFSRRNVAYVSPRLIVDRIGTGMVSVDQFDALDEVAQHAILNSTAKTAL